MRRFIPFLSRDPVVPVIRLQGVIASGARGAALNDAGAAAMIEKAFRRSRLAAVAIVVNSPGGSPVQSSLIAARIRRLAQEKKVKVIAFVEDVAASGGYWLACAADEIWADESSIVGSVGVISSSFGFQDFIARHGIERRVHTAGRSKSMLDPFRPEEPEDVARLGQLQSQIHQSFIDHVRTRRGARLSGDDLFTGEIWVGRGAIGVGLIDGIGHVVPKLKELYGDKVRLVPYRQRKPLIPRLSTRIADEAAAWVEARAHWARFGL